MRQRKRCEKNTKYRWATRTIINFFAVCLLVLDGSLVSAAPAALLSASSVVYEATDSNSTPMGNLVSGNTFELNGSITSENGENWYFITMSNGMQGYMKGEITTHMENAESISEVQGLEVQESEVEEENTVIGDVSQEETEEETETESTTMANVRETSNTQKKTYLMQEDTDRIREQMQQTETTQEESQEPLLRETWKSVDRSLLFLLCITLLSIILICSCYKRLLHLFSITRKYPEILEKIWTEKHKVKKRKKAKRSKKKRNAKEANKWKKNSLQK